MTKLSYSIAGAALVALAGCGSKAPEVSSTTSGGLATGEQPVDPGTAPAQDQAFRASQPSAGEPRPFQLPQIKQFKLGDVIDVYLVEQHDLPTVALELNFEGGTRLDPRGKEGLASICMSMLSEGTKELGKLEFEEQLANVASYVDSYAGQETQGVSMRTLTKNFDPTFELFADTITEPGLRRAELKRLVDRNLEALKQQKAAPGSVAGRLADSVLWGPKHPFGKIETERSLSRIRVSDCKRYHRSYVKPQGARLFVVGDMTEEQIRAKFEPLLARWKGKPRKIADLPEAEPRKGKIFFVDIPGSAQSTIYLAHFGPERTAEDYFANEIAGGILGGSFSSRLNMNLREEKGYSYGARGTFAYNREGGYFYAAASVRTDATRQSLLETLAEIRALQEGAEPPTEAELAREKNGAILGLPADFATARQTLSMYRSLVYYGLPLDYWNSYVDKVSAVTLDQVAASAKAHLTPQEAVILVVGDAKAPQIARDDSGKDVPLTDAEGKPVTLLDALAQIAETEAGGKNSLVLLDADGKVVSQR